MINLVNFVLGTIVAIAVLSIKDSVAEVKVISREMILKHNGKYHYHYELDNGSKHTQDGWLKHVDAEHDGAAVQGKFSYVADDGKTYTVSYTADENGYRPVGEHLPTAPPTPLSVLKALKYLEAHQQHPTQTNDNKFGHNKF